MRIPLKSRREIELMRAAGSVVHRVLQRCKEAAKPGVSTADLDRIAHETYTAAGATSLFKWYPTYRAGQGFPGNTCISVNDEVVHGIPSAKRVLQEGDVVSVDCGVRLNGYCGDAALTILVGKPTPEADRLCQITRETLELAIKMARPGIRWSDIAAKMQEYVETRGCSCVQDFVGHGIGTSLHEDPKVPNLVTKEFLRRGNFTLTAGMTLAVEPMVIWGPNPDVVVLNDGWTVVTKEGAPAAHYEHTLAITPTGCDVLTDGH